MTHRWVTRRHFPPLLSLFKADTRMGHRHTPLPLSKTPASACRERHRPPLCPAASSKTGAQLSACELSDAYITS